MSDKFKDGCIFCEVLKLEDSDENLIVHRGEHAYVILNRYPYNTGHLLIVPFEHVESYELLSKEARGEMMELINHATKALRKVYYPQAFNVGANIGEAAGAGIAPHVHFHVMPRWSGDTNFLTTIGQTRVVPEELCDSYERIHRAWDEVDG
ncbi:MAG: HIT domain-containing protein [Anaerolineaceae bacterium]|nr:HIT domain-containing protein [Anaerolineaceae bacterium]